MSRTKNAKKYYLKPNTVYGRWRTLEEVQIHTSKCLETRWRCIYLPTGEEKLCLAANLAKYQTEEQMQEYNSFLLNNNIHQMGFRHYLYRNSIRNAASRNHSFDLTFEEFDDLIQQNCVYCGAAPQTNEQIIKERGNSREPLFYYNGIDRIDSSIGYCLSNCVPCCSKCNYMKRAYGREEFLSHIKTIYEFLNLGSTTISKESTSQADGDGNGGPLTGSKRRVRRHGAKI